MQMDIDARLLKRYQELVRSHIAHCDFLSPGIKNTLSKNKAFAQTQGAWRFFNNEQCSLQELIKPVFASGLEESRSHCDEYALIAHDWSGLIYKTHSSKKDRFGVHHGKELGYELQSSLLLSDRNGGPLAPLAINVATKNELLSTYREDTGNGETHLEELTKRIHYLESSGFEKSMVHIIDREGDSVQLMRDMGEYNWLFRSRSNSRIVYNNVSSRVDQLAKALTYKVCREINYRGQKAIQYLSEAKILIDRIAQPKKRMDGRKQRIKGKPIEARFVVSKIQNEEGKLLSWWYLITNVSDVPMDQIALWYYWRWSIESFFKLLKSAGMQLESWQQETGKAIARRLLVASMACVFVWQIAESKTPEAGKLRAVLIKLSGRQMKYGVEFTRPALLAGLASLLTTLTLFDQYNLDELKQLLKSTIGVLVV
jgi:hypothetical protein